MYLVENSSQKNKKELTSELIREKFLSLPHEIITPKRGEVIFSQGDKVEKMGFILEGVMKCCKYTYSGEEVNTHYFYNGEIFPEYLYLTSENTYIYNLVTEKSARLILIDVHYMEELLMKDIEWANIIIDYIARRGLLAEKWTLCNSYSTLRSSIAYMLLEIEQVEENKWTKIRDTQKVVASKLQISRPMYNQELIKMEREGIIKRSNLGILLLSREKLETYI